MDEIVALIEKIIEEHRVIISDFQSLEAVANDASAIIGLEKAKDSFMPGRFDQKEGLSEFQESLEKVDKGVRAHFNREETALLAAFEKHGDRSLVTALKSLLLEHEDLRNRLDHSREHIAELASGGLARQQWEASAHDMRAHLSHTRKLFGTHAAIEMELLVDMRKHLQGKSAGKGK
ncbi:MAG: hypothetical protein A2144_12650 [Chloroflexi bacterium RBG_16_50_9]|nr:MAG: hypothetical protein A2144_12650 [Chloroflexi bacterium RBG_16_50_9]